MMERLAPAVKPKMIHPTILHKLQELENKTEEFQNQQKKPVPLIPGLTTSPTVALPRQYTVKQVPVNRMADTSF